MADDHLTLSGSGLWDDVTSLSASNLLLKTPSFDSETAKSDEVPPNEPTTPPAFSPVDSEMPDLTVSQLGLHDPHSIPKSSANDVSLSFKLDSPPFTSLLADSPSGSSPLASASSSIVSPLSAALSAANNIPTAAGSHILVSPSRSKRSSRRSKAKKNGLKSSINIFDKIEESIVIPDSSNPLLSSAGSPDEDEKDEVLEFENSKVALNSATLGAVTPKSPNEVRTGSTFNIKGAGSGPSNSKPSGESPNGSSSIIAVQPVYSIGNSFQDPSLLAPYPDIPWSEILDIFVGDPINVGDIRSAHTVYTVHTSKPNSPRNQGDSGGKISIVTRRYRDFRWLFHILQENHPGVFIPPPPEKQMVGRFNEEFIEHRRQFLNNMLQKIASHPLLFLDENFVNFLFNDSFNLDIKHNNDGSSLRITGEDEVQKPVDNDSGTDSLTDPSDSADQDDSSLSHTTKVANEFNRLSHEASAVLSASKNIHGKAIMGGGSSSSGGLLGIFSGNHFREFDSWFSEHHDVIDTLEAHLKNLLRSLELIFHSRQELVNNLNDFSVIMARFSITIQDLLNNNKKYDNGLNELVENFSATLHKIQRIYAGQRESNYIQIKMKLEEYIRIIQHSIRKSFLQREKFWHYNIQKDESILQKQLKTFEKLRKQYDENYKGGELNSNDSYPNQAASTRIEKLKLLIKSQENKLIDDNKKFLEITLTIKREFERFEITKVNEFGNMVEKFVNEAIESQTEAIETWGTFYQISGF
ncbi:PX-domain-containing protein [Nadsonia fulvescens var. elongata DSM 6958]|uniref:PX-domain-containing protein n=1 Tax=Nadsonia fulvescens var. elongata DSM 6958 TaxID=857566 RepID=A0A1E3PS05_9ASCO|nr:PX-domain-containing protein [Nadsonia fulvescens var. elongata DSM 6958]